MNRSLALPLARDSTHRPKWPKVREYVVGGRTLWERDPIDRLATERQLAALIRRGFWHPMDTLRDKALLENLLHQNAPWKAWE